MAADLSATGVVEIRLATTGAVWFGQIEAQGGEHLRVRLKPDLLGALPSLPAGTAVDCAMESEEGRYYADASVLEQTGPLLWLRIAPLWEHAERRRHARTTGGFPVTYRAEGLEGIGACMDISAGGMRLRITKALPLRASLELWFKLPGEPVPARTEGTVIYIKPAEGHGAGLDVGVKFGSMSFRDAARIARYCHD